MNGKYELILLAPAQRELEEIALVHLELVGPDSARKVIDRIYSALEKLQIHPNLGIACRDRQLASQGFRMLICGHYLCFYRLIADTVFIYHVVDGRSDYPTLLRDMRKVDLT